MFDVLVSLGCYSVIYGVLQVPLLHENHLMLQILMLYH